MDSPGASNPPCTDCEATLKTVNSMREQVEYWIVCVLMGTLSVLPRRVARSAGACIGWLAYRVLPRLRQVGRQNLARAFPEKTPAARNALLRRLYRNLGWLLVEFCQMPSYTEANTRDFLRYQGLEHFLTAEQKGKGVLIVTGHLGAWELSSFYHSLMGHPMSMVIRRLDNPRVDAMVNRIRCMHGNQVLPKDDFARGLLAAMRQGQAVGILMDTNMTPPQGIFVPFFDTPACTASGLARVALKTDAAVLPGFLLWHEDEQKYVLTFGEQIPLVRSGDLEADVESNTARFTAAIEGYIRAYPDQWLWVHRRWKTRPAGQGRIY